MKKLFALLLVLCMLVGLVACGEKKDPTANNNNPTTGSNTTDSTDPTDATTDPQYTVTPETSPYNGKTLQIYGMGSEKSYTNYVTFGKGNYLWMMKAAIEEWAAINGVTIVYKGSYNQNEILAAMNSGEKPDIVFQSNNFPTMGNAGITAGFTDAEYAKIAAVCDERFMELMEYRGEAHGFVVPWVGVSLCYYNKTMFENYGVKTPKEYFMEGNWTWTTFTRCMEEVTKDVDSDGVIDTYGIPADSQILNFKWIDKDENGNLVSILDTQYAFDYLQWRYDNSVTKQLIQSPGKNQIQKNVTYPMTAMQISDCEPYNFEHLYQSIANGDELEVVPPPAYDGTDTENRNYLNYTQSAMSLVRVCDEREAAVDLMVYLLKVGQKYISDFSLGAVKCEYAGMQGKCDLSKTWMEAFAKVCADRAVAIKEIENYDEELIAKMYEYFAKCSWTMNSPFTNVKSFTTYKEVSQLPPTSSIPAIKDKFQAQLDVYNDLYVNKK